MDNMIVQMFFHFIAATHFFYGCFYDYNYVIIPRSSSTVPLYGGKFKYLTFLDAMLQTTYFTIAFLNDLIGSNDPSPAATPLVRKLRDIIFCALAFPLAMFVGTTFWAIYAVDRELILPKSLDPYFPLWLNHLMHTNIMFFAFAELTTSFRMYPKKSIGFSILTSFMLVYVVWVHVIYYKSGGWVYPILAVLNWPLRISFYIVSLVIIYGFYHLGDKVNRAVWSKEVQAIERSERKKPQ